MKSKWWLWFAVLLWWGWRSQPVQAASLYDPVQGGLVYAPPADIWGMVGEILPVPYLAIGPGTPKRIPLANNQYQVDQGGQFVTVTTKGVSVAELTISLVNPERPFLRVRATQAGDYPVTLRIPNWPEYDRAVTFHILPKQALQLQAEVANQRVLSILPAATYWQDASGRRFAGTLTNVSGALTSTFFGLTSGVPVVLADGGVAPWAQTVRFAEHTLKSSYISLANTPFVTTVGIPDLTPQAGQPLALDALYPQPRKGSTLAFEWQFADGQQVTTTTPKLDASAVPAPTGRVSVTLVYTAGDDQFRLRTNTFAYRYQVPGPTTTTVPTIAALARGDVTVAAGLRDLQLPENIQRLTVAVTPLTAASGATLAATLLLPNGEQVPSTAAETLVVVDRSLALTQALWLLHHQRGVQAGTYAATIRFTLIAGP